LPSASFTRSTTAIFSFTSAPGSTFECRLNEADFTPCSSPRCYSSLDEGHYVFQVRARDLVGTVDPTPAEHRWTVDRTPPESGVELASLPPAHTNLTSVRLSLLASEPSASFQCSLDGAAFASCTNPQGYDSLADGPHTFQVKATDRAGNVDPTASTYTWEVDTVAPGTELTSTPPALTRAAEARFSFSTEPGASFECRLNDAAFTPCLSPHGYAALRDGDYVLQVRARDLAGNADSTPAEFHWTVDRTEPETGIDPASAPPAHTNLTSVNLAFFASEPGASFECGLDGAAFTSCTNPQRHEALADGPHTFRVQATDAAGNVDATPAEYPWTVDTVCPGSPNLQVPTPHQRVFTSRPVFSGTAEPGSTVKVFVDGAPVGEIQANEGGYWELASSQLKWGSHRATATTTDPAGNSSDSSLEVAFATVQGGYYGLSCSAGPSGWLPWPWALVALGLLRRRRVGPRGR
jgi:large repetitive protein